MLFNKSAAKEARLGDRLVGAGTITSEQLRTAREEMERDGGRLPEQLVALDFVDEVRLLEAMAEIYEMPVVGAEALLADPEMLELLPELIEAEGSVLPLKRVGKTLNVAVTDPSDREALERLEASTDLKVCTMLAGPTAVREARARLQMMAAIAKMPGEKDLGPYVPLFASFHDLRFVRTVARGGFARVFQFNQMSLNRVVAVKVLDREWGAIAEVARRFDQEGEIIARLDHPNIVRVYEQGSAQGYRYIVMEYFEGETIDKALRGRDLVSKLACLRSVASALAYAHGQGIIHRDIKPGNILMNVKGQVKLLDFGVARMETGGEAQMTRAQLVLGTPRFMAPEIKEGARNASPQSDIFAFGVMAHDVLTEARCDPEKADHPSMIDTRIPTFLGRAVLGCLAHDAEQRPGSFHELEQVIQQALDQLIFGDGTSEQVAESDSPRMEARNDGPAVSPLYEEILRERQAAGQGRLQSLESRYEFKSVLRKDERSKTAVAFHRRLGRPVVIKVVRKRLTTDKAEALKRALSEHIAQVYGVGKREGAAVVVREHLDGGTLAERMGQPMEPAAALEVLEAVVTALREAKKLNLGHGNLHPGNVLFGSDGSIKVSDFGIATQAAKEFPQYRGGEGNMMGDRFALGVMAYELIAGKPFERGRNLESHMQELANNRRAHPLLKYFLGRLWRIKRYQPAYNDYEDMLADLERIRSRMKQQEEWVMQREREREEGARRAAEQAATQTKTAWGRTMERLASLVK